jgi:hypothetical protein
MTKGDFVPHLVFKEKTVRLPSPSKLKWLSGKGHFFLKNSIQSFHRR